MSVMQRKLFSSKEARTKLRDMGGIMSSFPELSGEVQRFQDGMMVEAPPVTGSGMTPANVAPITYEQWRRMTRSARQAVGLPTSEIGAQLYFNRFGAGLGLNDPSTGERLAAVTPEMLDRQRRIEFAAQGEFAGMGGEEAGPPESRVEPPRQRVAAVEGGNTSVEEPEEEPEEQPVVEPEAPGLGDLLPDAAETEGLDPDSLRARAEQRIELFRDLFGDDEPTARDRAMQFAMIGLAIAAGQSPNALTNIASGLLAGTQAMSAEEARRRGVNRELRATALESVLEEQELDRRLGADAVQRERRAANELAQMRTDAYQTALAAASDDTAMDYDSQLETPQQYATRKADEVVQFYIQSLEAGGGSPTPTVPAGISPDRIRQNPETGEVIYWDGSAWVPVNG